MEIERSVRKGYKGTKAQRLEAKKKRGGLKKLRRDSGISDKGN